MQRLIDGYDRHKGRQHNLTTIIKLSRALAQQGMLDGDWKLYWGLCLCFDALIGNTDRHQENWGLIWNADGSKVRFAPYFDNGTSLGHELQPEKMQRMMRDPKELEAYLRRGKHQMRWSKSDSQRLPLIEGVVRYCQHYPEVRKTLMDRLNQWSKAVLEAMLVGLTRFDIPAALTSNRAEFIAFLILTRRERLLQALEN